MKILQNDLSKLFLWALYKADEFTSIIFKKMREMFRLERQVACQRVYVPT